MIRSWNWRHPALLLAGACCVAFAWLLQRHLGLNPAVFADEWYYSKMARLGELREAEVPSYLYLWLFRWTNACGAGFLDCARAGNTLLFVAAAPLVYLCARAFTSARLALLVAALALLAPLKLYTSFFMPETMYYFGFWVLSWIALTRTQWLPDWRALACGAMLGLMSLVKVHALFLLPALCLFLLYEHWRAGPAWLGGAGRALVLAAAAAFALKFALGYLFAGPDGLTLFGTLYGGSATRSAQRTLAAMAGPAFVNLRGHAMAMAVLFALPLALIAQGLASRRARAAAPALARLQLYTLLMLGAALGMTVLYTASIAAPDNQDAVRLHLRYYNFVFPLLLAVCAAQLVSPPAAPAPAWLRATLALLLAALMALALARLPTYFLSMIDGPDITAIDLRRAPGLLVLGLQLAALLLWAGGNAAAPRLFLFAAAPAAMLVAARAEQNVVHQLVPTAGFYADAAAEFGRRTIPRTELGQTTVAATGTAELYRMQFHLDDRRVQLLDLPEGAPVDPAQVPPGSKWLLVAGPHALPPGYALVGSGFNYQLAESVPRGRPVGSASLGGALPNGLVASASGLSVPEGWGRWSDGRQVTIRLATPLPRHASVVLTASAYGPNSKLPFTLRAGGGAQQFAVNAQLRPVNLLLETDGHARELTIEVPQPVSPRALGQSMDQRMLGLALSRIEVFDVP
jgi:hypothetical protein